MTIFATKFKYLQTDKSEFYMVIMIKRFFVKYWWTFPLLLALSMLSLIVLFTKTPSILETIIEVLLLLVVINVMGIITYQQTVVNGHFIFYNIRCRGLCSMVSSYS